MEILDDLRYTENHEWAKVDGDFVFIGITSYATNELGEIVHVELPDVGDQVTADDPLGTLEAVKTVEDIYSPVSGTIDKVNADLFDSPNLINDSPYQDGWLVKIRYSNKTEIEKLLTAEEYKSFLRSH